jgi:uncharacterized protein YecA (UPF0149 family)
MTPDQIMAEFSREGAFPEAAMRAATAQREVMTPIFIDLVTRLSNCPTSDVTRAEDWQLAPVLHLLAEWRETKAYKPFLTMMQRDEIALDYLLGDTVTESADRIMASVFNGDLAPLMAAVEDADAFDFARASMLRALVLVSHEHKGLRPEVEAFIRDFRNRNDDLSEDLLYSWVTGIAALGLEDMIEQVSATFELGEISPMLAGFEHFEADLQETLSNHDSSAFRRNGSHVIESAINEMQWWYCYSEKYREERRQDAVRNVLNIMPRQEFDIAPRVNVGRNDPCPCGSGKKFKKCCLH